MSHSVCVQASVTNLAALRAACAELGLAEPVTGRVRLFANYVEGMQVQLPGWRYPVVFDLQKGTATYDNFSGTWGEQQKLDQLLQRYHVEVAKQEALRQGHDYQVMTCSDGWIEISVEVEEGGGYA